MTRRARPFYLDLDDGDTRSVSPGDLLLGTRSVQVVLAARPTESAVDRNRWTLSVRTIGRRPQTRAEWAAARSVARPQAREIEYVRWHR